MNDVPHILIVEDQSSDYELAQREIRKVIPDCMFERVEKQTDLLKALKGFQPDVILSDYKLPGLNGLKVLALTQQQSSVTPVIIWTGAMSEDVAVDCIKRGASNYILKENLKRLGPALIHALKEREAMLDRNQAEKKYRAIFENSPIGIFQSTPDGRFINVNAAMASIYGYDSPQEMIESATDIANQLYLEPHERDQFTELLRANAGVENFEMKNHRKDGSIIWTSTSAFSNRNIIGEMDRYSRLK